MWIFLKHRWKNKIEEEERELVDCHIERDVYEIKGKVILRFNP